MPCRKSRKLNHQNALESCTIQAALYSNKGTDNDEPENRNNNFGFRSKKRPPQNELLKPFEDDLIKLVRSVEFKRIESPFLKKLNEDAKFITENENIFVFADKTTNIYSVSKENYEKVLKENVTKHYKKSNPDTCKQINNEAASIALKLELADRMECFLKMKLL